MQYRYIIIRLMQGNEAIGMFKIPVGSWVQTVHHVERGWLGVKIQTVTKAEYESYQEFELLQEYEWISGSPAIGNVIVYDPRAFYVIEEIDGTKRVTKLLSLKG